MNHKETKDTKKDDAAASEAEVGSMTGWKQIQHILEEEANQMALILDNGKSDARLKDAGFPPRFEIAVRREMNRLRELAELAKNASNASAQPRGD